MNNLLLQAATLIGSFTILLIFQPTIVQGEGELEGTVIFFCFNTGRYLGIEWEDFFKNPNSPLDMVQQMSLPTTTDASGAFSFTTEQLKPLIGKGTETVMNNLGKIGFAATIAGINKDAFLPGVTFEGLCRGSFIILVTKDPTAENAERYYTVHVTDAKIGRIGGAIFGKDAEVAVNFKVGKEFGKEPQPGDIEVTLGAVEKLDRFDKKEMAKLLEMFSKVGITKPIKFYNGTINPDSKELEKLEEEICKGLNLKMYLYSLIQLEKTMENYGVGAAVKWLANNIPELKKFLMATKMFRGLIGGDGILEVENFLAKYMFGIDFPTESDLSVKLGNIKNQVQTLEKVLERKTSSSKGSEKTKKHDEKEKLEKDAELIERKINEVKKQWYKENSAMIGVMMNPE